MITDQAAARRALGDGANCGRHGAPVTVVAWAPGPMLLREWWVIVYACGCTRLRGDEELSRS